MNAETSTYYDYYHHLYYYYYYHYIRVLAFVLFLLSCVCVCVCVYIRIYIDFHFFPVSSPFSETNKEEKLDHSMLCRLSDVTVLFRTSLPDRREIE